MRDLTGDSITDAVITTFNDTKDPRVAEILHSLVRHLHDFVREVTLTDEEWGRAIDFLTRTGELCTPQRQEFILLSDILGVTMLVDALGTAHRSHATQNSVLGPYFRDERPTIADGADISQGLPGEPLYFEGHVLDPTGTPVPGAGVDVWHSDGEGHYDVEIDGRVDPAMRALLRTDTSGAFSFRSIRPSAYPIPGDGTVGEVMRATGRPLMRPAHIHVLIDAPGHHRVTTMVFPSDDVHLDADPVFGVRESLITHYETHPAGTGPHAGDGTQPYTVVRHTFVLEPVTPA